MSIRIEKSDEGLKKARKQGNNIIKQQTTPTAVAISQWEKKKEYLWSRMNEGIHEWNFLKKVLFPKPSASFRGRPSMRLVSRELSAQN